MSVSRMITLLAASMIFSTAAVANAQQGMPPMPKPGPEHQIFKDDAGTWDATIEMMPPQGGAPTVSKGVETNTVACGGLCLITEFRGDFGGMPFDGHGTTSWDPAKKKYVGSWTDSMSQGIAMSEGTWDPASKTVTGSMEGPDATGKTTKMKTVSEYQGDKRIFSMYGTGPDGKEALGMRITYTRRKP